MTKQQRREEREAAERNARQRKAQRENHTEHYQRFASVFQPRPWQSNQVRRAFNGRR